MVKKEEIRQYSYQFNPDFGKEVNDHKPLQPPKANISALIRTTRWTFLGLGILYGVWHMSRLTRKEDAAQPRYEKLLHARQQKALDEKRRLNKIELEELGKQIGVSDLAKSA